MFTMGILSGTQYVHNIILTSHDKAVTSAFKKVELALGMYLSDRILNMCGTHIQFEELKKNIKVCHSLFYSLAWWLMPTIPEFGRLTQEGDCKFRISLGCIVICKLSWATR